MNASGATELKVLPPELLRACLSWLSPDALLAVAATCHLLRVEAEADELWAALYAIRWPSWTLLALTWPPSMVSYRVRQSALQGRLSEGAQLSLAAGRVFMLNGHSQDTYDGNVTPMRVILCRAPAGLERIQLSESALLGQVQYAAGSLHNVPRRRTLLGKALGHATDVDGRSVGINVEWREPSDNFGHWVYKGCISLDGRRLCGSFHLSVLPRKRGSFELTALEPTLGEDSVYCSLRQLVRRVVVGWANGALERRAAQADVMAGAAAI